MISPKIVLDSVFHCPSPAISVRTIELFSGFACLLHRLVSSRSPSSSTTRTQHSSVLAKPSNLPSTYCFESSQAPADFKRTRAHLTSTTPVTNSPTPISAAHLAISPQQSLTTSLPPRVTFLAHSNLPVAQSPTPAFYCHFLP